MTLAPYFRRVLKLTMATAFWIALCNLLLTPLSAQCTNPQQVPNGTITSGTASYSDTNALATGSNFVVNLAQTDTASVTFQAGNCINLKPGFHATAGTAPTTFHAWVNLPPANISVNPNSGSAPPNTAQTFTAVYSDPSGASDISYTQLLITTDGSGTSACYVMWWGGTFYLSNDAADYWYTLLPGGTVSNSQCTLSGAGSSTSQSGQQLTVTVNLSFKPAFGGTKSLFMRAGSQGGASSVLQQMGTFTIGSGGGTGGNYSDLAKMTSPASGSKLPGAAATFSWSTGNNVTQYFLMIGSSPGASDIYAAQTSNTSATVSNLPTAGTTVFISLSSMIAGGWQPPMLYFYEGAYLGPLPRAPFSGTASFVKVDLTTSGTWKNTYGSNGYRIGTAFVSYPGYLTEIITASGAVGSCPTWPASTTDPRALQLPGSGSDRIATCISTPSFLTIDLQFNDSGAHQVALYLLDWDGSRQWEQVVVEDISNVVLDYRIPANLSNGEYLVWNLSGHVRIRLVVSNPYSTTVFSGLFFDPAVNTGPTLSKEYIRVGGRVIAIENVHP